MGISNNRRRNGSTGGSEGAVVYLTSVLPQSDLCSARRLHKYVHETRSKDPG